VRICHIISGDLWAGAEVMACHLLKRLAASSDFDISVILLNEGRLACELRSGGLSVHVVDESRHSFAHIALRAGDILRRNPPHIIHSHRYKENLLAFLLSLRLPGVRLVSTQHGLPEAVGKTSLPQRFKSQINFFLLNRYFRTVAVSRDIRMRLTEQSGFSAERISVIHNGIALPSWRLRDRRKGRFMIGSSGRLFPVKDYPLMVQVAAEVAATNRDVRFLLAGEGPERSALEKQIAALGLEGQFTLAGHLETMDSFYRGIDLYLNTSVHEGIPMTILEAMAHGLPVVAPRVGGIREIVEEGVDGFLVDGRDPKAFARKCLLLQRDEALWKRMSLAAREKALRYFSVERMAADYHRLYMNLDSGYVTEPAKSGVGRATAGEAIMIKKEGK
jgi:L-malate glycosyltransferase